MYYDFEEPISKIAPHRVLAINRGEKEEFLSVNYRLLRKELLNGLKVVLLQIRVQYSKKSWKKLWRILTAV